MAIGDKPDDGYNYGSGLNPAQNRLVQQRGPGPSQSPITPAAPYIPYTTSGSQGTGPNSSSYGPAFNYGVATPETQYEVNRASDLAAGRAGDLFGRGDTNANRALGAAAGATGMGGEYANRGFADQAMSGYDRSSQYDALGRLRNFYEQGPGPSAAEAQLRMGQDAAMAQQIAMAHSGRGAGANANALRNAAFSNAASNQQLNQQLGVLRAQEAANWRQQQLGAMGLEQGTLGTMRGQDISSAGMNAQSGLGYGNLGLGYTQAGMQNQLGWGQLGSQQQMEGERLRQQILGQQLNANVAIQGHERGFQASQGSGDDNNAALWGGLGALAGGVGGFFVGGPVGAAVGAGAGSQIGRGAAESDIRAKKGIRQESFADYYRLYGGGQEKSAKATPENPTAKMEAPKGEVRSPLAETMRATGDETTAPWEMGVSPFAQQAPAQPFGQDPRLEQRIIPLDFTQPPYESDRSAKEHASRYVSSPVEAKKDIRPVSMADAPPEYAKAWQGVSLRDALFPPESPREYSAPIVPGRNADLRPAQGFSYEYKNPADVGAAPGRHYGPMAQDLMKTPAGASTVVHMPNGKLGVDTGRLALVNTAAISEQQNKLDRLLAYLDDANARASHDTGARFGGRR